jgi:predicted O-methyltransferase YrrM
VNRVLYRFGFALVSDHFYQPLPSRRALEQHRQDLRATADVDAQEAFVVSLLDEYRDEIASGLGAFGYGQGRTQMPRVDADVLYAMVRRQRPRRVIEIGSGSSTAVIAAALHRNALDGAPSSFTSIDPYAQPLLTGRPHDDVQFAHLGQPVQDVALDRWRELEAGDVLFVDSSHVFKPGSDVEYEFLSVYPALQRGVLVHLHDIFFPGDYPLEWTVGRSQWWNEQHVLAAVLENSDRFEVVAGLAAINAAHPGVFDSVVPGVRRAYRPGSIWLRVTA